MPAKTKLTVLQKFDQCPPVAVRVAAVHRKRGHNRHKVQRMKVDELARTSGISRRTFHKMSYLTSWENITVGQLSRFCDACGVDMLKKKPLAEFVKVYGKHKLSFLLPRQRRRMDAAIKKLKEKKG